MIAKIGRSSNLFGTLSYNNLKMEQQKGEILLTNKIIETADGKYSVAQLARSFEPYLLANKKTEKHTLHISLNPDPKDKVSDEQYREMAQLYMNEMGYGEQPFVVFKHTDIDRTHIHIVSVCVDETGRKIPDKFEKVRSMKVCRDLEKKFNLLSAIEKVRENDKKALMPVNYKAGNVKSQIASAVRHLPSYYKFQSLGEYNALLSLYNITAEKVEGELQGRLQKGLLYFPLNENGKKTGNPFKASLFGKNAGIGSLEKYFSTCKGEMNNHPQKLALKTAVKNTLESAKDKINFKKELAKKGIDTVIRENDQGRIYGITFIDHQSRTVWNGSRLGKECSANVFNDRWACSQENKDSKKENPSKLSKNDPVDFVDALPLFYFVNRNGIDLIESFGGFLPEAQVEDYDEIDFENRMKRRKKRPGKSN